MAPSDHQLDSDIVTADDDDFKPGSRPEPQKRAYAKDRKRAKVTKSDHARAESQKRALEIRLECAAKMKDLNAIADKDEGSLTMIAAIRRIQVQQWPKLVFHLYRPPPSCEEAHDDPRAWHTYEYTRGEVVSKLLDFVGLHMEICEAVGKTPYRTLWSHTQIEESIPTRIIKFTDFLISRGETRGNLYPITIRKWQGGEDYPSWIEVFQVTEATYQDEEELLDYRLW